jgi:uncharacterized hydrophobic protein (TIGR00271 family)
LTQGNHPGVAGIGNAGFSAGGRRSARTDDASWDADLDTEGAGEDNSDRSLILASVARDARLDTKYILLIVMATAIATLGLLQSSAPVVIGAMLVSPLLGPIMGIGFGLAVIDPGLIKRSLVTLLVGVLIAIAVASLIIWLSPIKDVTPEIRARTQPTLIDLGVAVIGGIAGVYAILRTLSGVMVGVAIATALVPPLSTVAFGLTTGRYDFAMGAGLLFITNTIAIAMAATAVARLNRFGPSLTAQHTMMQVAGIVAALSVLVVPLGISFNNIAREVRARHAVQAELGDMLGRGDRVDSMNVRVEGNTIAVDGVVLVNLYDPQLAQKLTAALNAELKAEVRVSIAQLRQHNSAAAEGEAQLNRRLTMLEERGDQSRAILAGLTVGELVPRTRVLIDDQARRVIVQRDFDKDNEQLNAAIDRIVAGVQRDFPDWLIQNGQLTAAAAAEEQAAAQAATAGE